jgi:hypothetical protein
MGWCTVGTSGEQCEIGTCNEIHGNWEEKPRGGCLLLSLLEDPVARSVVRAMIYPPILMVRDEVLPRTPVGRVIVGDFERHYAEAVEILRKDPDLLELVIDFLMTNVPFARAMLGGKETAIDITGGWTPSTYVAARLRHGTVDSFSQILERFRSNASDELAADIAKYLELVPKLANLTPRELLTELRSRELTELVRR